jgi:hypothetical protein
MSTFSKTALIARQSEANFEVVNIHSSGNFFLL